MIINFRDYLCSSESIKQSNVYSQMYKFSNKSAKSTSRAINTQVHHNDTVITAKGSNPDNG